MSDKYIPPQTKYRALLARQGIKQLEVCRKIRMSQCKLSRFTKGYHNLTLEGLKRLVIFHRVSPNEILDWEKWIRDFDEKHSKK